MKKSSTFELNVEQTIRLVRPGAVVVAAVALVVDRQTIHVRQVTSSKEYVLRGDGEGVWIDSTGTAWSLHA